MSKSDKVAVRKAEGVVPRSVRLAEKKVDRALRGLAFCQADEIWDDVEDLDELETRFHLNHKQALR